MNDSLIGSLIAGYRIDRLLGRGGMASIYFAWDTRNNRPVALKVMDERYRGTPAYVDRFIHEAQTISTWDHPNIVKVFDAGEEGGIYFYAMEFIRGLDLAQLLRQYLDASQLLPYNEVTRIGWAVASALDFAHNRGIIHRDVKPSNVLISVDGRVLLSDFGLVMDVSRGTLGETFGSPQYIAPEQARSSAGAVPQSDNYSLGVMLYEILTGALPFNDTSPTALALKHLNEEPPRPRSLNPRLSQAVEAVLLRALRKRPEERYATGRELMLALERALESELRSPEASTPLPVSPTTHRVQSQRSQPIQPNRPNPGGTSVYPVEQPIYPPGYGNARPGGTGSQAAATQAHGQPAAAPSYQGATQYPTGGYPPNAPPPAPPAKARGSRGFGFGCLAAGLALLALAVGLGAVMAMNPGWFQFPAAVPGEPDATETFSPPTLTITATLAPSETLQPTTTGTPVPTLTETPVPTLTETPTLEPPTETPIPTATPVVHTLLLARRGNDGFVLVNTGDQPLTLAPLVISDNAEEFSATEWVVETLLPDQCVAAWEPDTQPRLPSGVECEPVGEIPIRAGGERFWTRPIRLLYNDQEIAACRNNTDRCEIQFSILPQ